MADVPDFAERDCRGAIDYVQPISDYGGFGVRWGWDGSMIFNARGDRGVEIVLKRGKRIVVGSQRSTDLERAIDRP